MTLISTFNYWWQLGRCFNSFVKNYFVSNRLVDLKYFLSDILLTILLKRGQDSEQCKYKPHHRIQ